MNNKSALRILAILLLAGLIVVGLTSCRLPASKGPAESGGTSEQFPLPGETEQTGGGIDVGAFATQTAQAKPPEVIASPTQPPVQSTSTSAPQPEATKTPEVPVVTSTPITYIEPTQGTLPVTYTLQEGEYPFCIARRFNVNQSELLELNGISPDTLVGPGTELKIPQTGNPFSGDRALQEHPTTYTVQEGDSLNSIACSFGDVAPDLIARQNNLTSNEVTPGTELVIP